MLDVDDLDEGVDGSGVPLFRRRRTAALLDERIALSTSGSGLSHGCKKFSAIWGKNEYELADSPCALLLTFSCVQSLALLLGEIPELR